MSGSYEANKKKKRQNHSTKVLEGAAKRWIINKEDIVSEYQGS